MRSSHIITLLGGAVLVLTVTVAYLLGYERGNRNTVRGLPVERADVSAASHRISRDVPPPSAGSRFTALPSSPSVLEDGAQSQTSGGIEESVQEHVGGSDLAPDALPVPTVLVAADRNPSIRFNATPGTNSFVRMQGTSTVGDWEVESKIIGGYVEVGQQFPTHTGIAKPGKVEVQAEVFIPVRSLKSVRDGKPYSSDMDSLMYRELVEATHRHIKYSLTGLVLNEPAKGDEPLRFESIGNLTVAGVTREIGMPVELWMGTNALTFRGLALFKMSDFGIQPPTATPGGGLIKTGDDVKVSIQWNLSRRTQ